jgi:hypothetical protein
MFGTSSFISILLFAKEVRVAGGFRSSNDNGSQPEPAARAFKDVSSVIVARLELHLATLRKDGPSSLGPLISDLEQVLAEIRRELGESDED